MNNPVPFHGFSPDARIFSGEGVIETLRVVAGETLFVERHHARMEASARALGIPWTLDLAGFGAHIADAMARASPDSNGVRVVVGSCSAPRGLASQSESSGILIQPFVFTPVRRAVALVSASWKRDSANPVYQHKTVNYLESILALRATQGQSVGDVLFHNTRDEALETTTANLFVFHRDEVLTPALDCGVLPGITRARVLEYCAENGVSARETAITPDILAEAEALALTNSLQGMMAVQQLDGRTCDTRHPTLRLLQDGLSALVSSRNQQV